MTLPPENARLMIRFATAADALALAELHAASWNAAYKGLVSDDEPWKLTIAEQHERWRHILSTNASEVQTLVSIDDEAAITGLCAFAAQPSNALMSEHGESNDSPGAAELLALYVAPERWGHGHGGALMSACIRHVRAMGSHNLSLWVFEANSRARAFYVSRGFFATGQAGAHAATGAVEIRLRLDFDDHPGSVI